MEKHQAGWSRGAFFLCEKCGRRNDAGPGLEGFAESAKAEFKSKLREMGKGREIRVMVSGCLGLCPPERQCAAWVPNEGATELLEFNADERKAVFDWLCERK